MPAAAGHSGFRGSLAAYSCGGSHGIGANRRHRTVFPFHPALHRLAGNHRRRVLPAGRGASSANRGSGAGTASPVPGRRARGPQHPHDGRRMAVTGQRLRWAMRAPRPVGALTLPRHGGGQRGQERIAPGAGRSILSGVVGEKPGALTSPPRPRRNAAAADLGQNPNLALARAAPRDGDQQTAGAIRRCGMTSTGSCVRGAEARAGASFA